MNQPETRPSLLIRIRNSEDRDAWNEFANIYRPAIIRLAKFKGLQNADAEDLAQKVLLSVSRDIKNWRHDENRARFRTWLTRVTYNAVFNVINRAVPDRGTGNSDVTQMLNEHPARKQADSELLLVEVRREIFRFAADEIRSEFHEGTWAAFWRSAVEGIAIETVARDLGKTRGSVYAARSRVMSRLNEKIEELQLLDPSLGYEHD